MSKTTTIQWAPFSDKHKAYIKNALHNKLNVAEGSIRSGKTIDHCIIAAAYLETCPDRLHLASGSTQPNAKLNIGVCNGFGLEFLFRGRCHYGKYRGNECLYINTQTGEKIVIFVGGGKADSYKKILGNSYGLWIATEINEHYDCEDSQTSFIKVAMGRQLASKAPLILWDLNPTNPKDPIYSNYIDGWLGTYPGGYQYQHFTLYDNASLTEERLRDICSIYTPGSIWHRRDILGERCVSEGLVYEHFANDPEWYMCDTVPPLYEILIGEDFGNSQNNHAYVAVGFTRDRRDVWVLRSESYPAKGTSTETINSHLCRFATEIQSRYGFITAIYPDCAEQALIETQRNLFPGWNIIPCIKNEILDRIRCTDHMMCANRLHILRGTNDALVGALSSAVWDEKHPDTRLKDGSYDGDVLDAFEYAFEPNIRSLLEA